MNLIGKDPDAGKDGRQEEKGAAEYEMVGWHHQLNGHESEQTPGDSERQGRGHQGSDRRLNNWTATTTTCICFSKQSYKGEKLKHAEVFVL